MPTVPTKGANVADDQAQVLPLHGCEAVTYTRAADGLWCDQPATLWTAPTGREWYVCPRHQAEFAEAMA